MPVPSVGPVIGANVLEFLKSRDINYYPKLRLKEVRRNKVLFESEEMMPFDLLFCVPPHQAPRPVAEAGLTDGTGWVPVNPRTFETSRKGVYAVGDVTSVPTPHGYFPFLPKAGVFAHGQAEVVANNIAVEIKGRGKTRKWDGHGSCFLEVGRAQSAFLKGRFFAEPKPDIEFHAPSRIWHMQKVLFEKYWMHHWF
jgi:sulfide:quinone oxidoreductase